MRVLQINHFSYKAAGNIMMNIHEEMKNRDIETYVVWGRGRTSNDEYEYYMDDSFGVKMHALMTRITDKTGFYSNKSTKKLIEWIELIHPDVIHLHCIHGYYINIERLFVYIKSKNIQIIWTIHDCWPFTGHCAYYDMINCERWKEGCYSCPQKNTYPKSLVDGSKYNWIKKKELFSDVNAVLVSPSEWLAEEIKKSFLGEYKIRVINNGIDLSVFRYNNEKKNVLSKYGLDSRPIILCVASEWTERKGLNDILEISKQMKECQIVVVGLTEKQKRRVPDTVVGIKRTENVHELVSLYSAADVFYNPTYEEVFGMVNIEALACGTPVVTYDSGGSPETIMQEENSILGSVIKKKDNKSVEIKQVISEIRKYIHNDCKNSNYINARIEYVERFSVKKMIDQYIELYKEVVLK